MKTTDAINNFIRIDDLAERDTPVHALHPLAKIIVTFVFIVNVVSINNHDFSLLCGFFFYPAIMLNLAEINSRFLFKRLLPVLPLVMCAGISNIIFDTAPIWLINGFGISGGVVSCLVLIAKTLLTVSAAIILTAATPTVQLFAQLRKCGIPQLLIMVLFFCLRYFELLLHEAEHMQMAYSLRAPQRKSLEFRDVGSFLAQLLLRTADKAENIFKAMQCRGFNGKFNLNEIPQWQWNSTSYLLISVIFILLLRFYNPALMLEKLF